LRLLDEQVEILARRALEGVYRVVLLCELVEGRLIRGIVGRVDGEVLIGEQLGRALDDSHLHCRAAGAVETRKLAGGGVYLGRLVNAVLHSSVATGGSGRALDGTLRLPCRLRGSRSLKARRRLLLVD